MFFVGPVSEQPMAEMFRVVHLSQPSHHQHAFKCIPCKTCFQRIRLYKFQQGLYFYIYLRPIVFRWDCQRWWGWWSLILEVLIQCQQPSWNLIVFKKIYFLFSFTLFGWTYFQYLGKICFCSQNSMKHLWLVKRNDCYIFTEDRYGIQDQQIVIVIIQDRGKKIIFLFFLLL